ncbi:hypothetical protein HPB51_021327 [Rhipicephalus microplus]|uniref:Alpha 1,4-glycosyltransferase domain-containing protein n=1 Tax=Rhipicephalus microplus TaxID=6941 RepID=A0A9J6F6B6_RHIMP|nr:hypothetical protein HPB51_021327 [Rhipicephalus microplus]
MQRCFQTSPPQDTVLDLWLREGAYKRSPYETVHLSDGLRLALLLKHGGVYVDFDVIFLRSLEGLGDAVVACSADDTVTNNFLAFTARHPFVRECLERFVWDYYPKDWGYNGPRQERYSRKSLNRQANWRCRLTKKQTENKQPCKMALAVRGVLLRWCNATTVEQALDNRLRCHGVTLLPRNRLLPLNYTTAHLLFNAAVGPNVSESFAHSYLVHTFHSRTRDIPAEHGSFVERAAAENCPRTFELAHRVRGYF